MMKAPADSFGDPIFWMALAVMALFYGIYLVKAFAQRRRGIQTRQLGRGSGKGRSTRAVEALLSVATYAIIPIQLFSMLRGRGPLPGGVRIAGIALGFLGDCVFLVAVVTMRDSWRAGVPSGEEKTALISDGIYRYSRNPAFLGFDLMYVGISLAYCNAILCTCTLLVVLLLHLQILQEERYLAAAFGGEYLNYAERTARYFGRRR